MRYQAEYLVSWIGSWLGHNTQLLKLFFLLVLLNVLATVLKGCTVDSFGPPVGTVEFSPPAIYTDWWAEVEKCSGRTGNFNRVVWFVTPDVSIPYKDVNAVGVWESPHRIYVAAQIADTTWQIVTNPAHGTPTDFRRFVVEHEMLHDLLQTGKHGELFDRCNLRTF